MIARSIALACLAAIAPLAPIALSQQDSDLQELLESRSRAAEELPVQELWAEASRLGSLGREIDEEATDRALDDLLRSSSATPHQVLLLVAARLAGDEPDAELLSDALIPLLASDDDTVARAAAGLLADGTFQLLPVERSEELVEELLATARKVERSPELRMDFAVTAYGHGNGQDVRDVQRILTSFLNSSDPALRGRAALALASVGEMLSVRGELERLAAMPGPEGRLAASYLHQEQLREFYETQIRKQKALRDEALRNSDLTGPLDSVERVMEMILQAHVEGDKVTDEELLDAALDGMLRSMDPHSNYFSPDVYAEFQQDLQAEYGGIGAYVGVDRDDNIFTITRPIYSGPAYEANLRSDDKIVRIDNWPTHDGGISKPTEDVIRRLKGEPGSIVRLYIWRRGMDPALIERPTEDMVVEVTRGLITIPPVQMQMLPENIGLIELTSFSGVASQELEVGLQQLLDDGAVGIVLDLRSNPGGLLSEARDVADLFLPKGKLVVSTESRVRETDKLETRKDALVPMDMPLMVMIDRFSASAAEIVAGALQDHGRATLVGQRSFGKGSVQNLVPMPGVDDDGFEDSNRNRYHDNWEKLTKDHNGNGVFDYAPRIKLTIARYLLPSGRSIHRELDENGDISSPGGVEPDEEIRQKRWETWKLEEMIEMQGDRAVRAYIDEYFDANIELFKQLAISDSSDSSKYPGFDKWYGELGTRLSKDDVRFLVRREVRRRVADLNGSAFPRGDYQQDYQLQRAIALILENLGLDWHDYPEFLLTFNYEAAGGVARDEATVAQAAGADNSRKSVRDALELIAAARSNQAELSREDLDRLTELLSELDH
jgi:carboxyl-terminal processing protease